MRSLGLFVLLLTALMAPPAWAEVRVVVSFSILADMAKQIGGDKVSVVSLVPPGGDAHVHQPKPTDAKALADARLVIVNGLGFDTWADRLLKSTGYKGALAVASRGVDTIAVKAHSHAHGHGGGGKEPDPHAWQDLARAQIYVRNIAAALAAADPANAGAYAANGERYAAELRELDTWTRAEIGAIPADKRKVITSHDAFGYFAAAYGVTFLAPAGVSTEKEPSAKDVARIARQAKAEGVKAVFVEKMSDPRLVEQLAREAGAAVGGTLYSDTLSPAGGSADSFAKLFRHNVTQLREGMSCN